MVAEELGNNQWLVAGPLVLVLALAVCILLSVHAAKRRRQYDRAHAEEPKRGPVSGGVIEGSPVQRNRRDKAPRRDPH